MGGVLSDSLLLLLSSPISLCLKLFLQTVCRLRQAGMDQCLLAPPAELISIPTSHPPPPPQSACRSWRTFLFQQILIFDFLGILHPNQERPIEWDDVAYMILFCILLQSYEWLPRKRSNLERMLADQNQPLGILLQFVFHFLQRHPHGAGRSNTSCRQKDNITYQIGWFFVKFSKGGGCVCV